MSAEVSTRNARARRRGLKIPLGVIVPVGAVIGALFCGVLLILAFRLPLPDALASFVDGAFGSPYAISVSLNRAAVYALVGLGFIFANRAGLTNVGGEGQIAIGGIAATATALAPGVGSLPLGLAFIVPTLAAAIAGAGWGGVAGVLKARVGTNEVISTLLLNFIAIWLVYWCVQSEHLLRQPMTTAATLPESPTIPDATQLPFLTGDPSAPVTIGVGLTVVLAVVIAVVLNLSRFGMQLRAVGLNPTAATRAGFSTPQTVVTAFLAAGALGGLAGALMLLGDQYSLKAGFSSGYGYDGLVVGLLARGSTIGVFAAALLFGFLRSAGIAMEMSAGVPSALVLVVQGLIVVSVAGAAFWLDRDRSARG
jgi:simple sugar transport system permease protein